MPLHLHLKEGLGAKLPPLPCLLQTDSSYDKSPAGNASFHSWKILSQSFF